MEHQGVVSGTPETSDDEDEDDNEHDSIFCALQQQKISWMVSPNERTKQNFYHNDPAPPQIVPHKLITSVKPHEKSRSLEGRGIGTQQKQINVDASIVNIGCCTSSNGLQIKQSYMANEAFLSMYSYGGGKRKKKDFEADYDPMNSKKRKERKRIRKKK